MYIVYYMTSLSEMNHDNMVAKSAQQFFYPDVDNMRFDNPRK